MSMLSARLNLMVENSSALKTLTTKKGHCSSGLFCLVAGAGFEPTTFGL